MQITTGAACDIGRARRSNQDATLLRQLAGGWLLVAVADGMGGLAGGEIASNTAIGSLSNDVASEQVGGSTAEARLRRGFGAAHGAVRTVAADERIGTTLVAALVSEGWAYVANVGDSRAYLLHDGHIEQITEDHSMAAERARAGLMTAEEAAESKFRHVLIRAIGVDAVAPIVDTFGPIALTDASLLLCSDGLYCMLTDDEIAAVIYGRSPQDAADALVDMANERGGRDNISVVIVSCRENA